MFALVKSNAKTCANVGERAAIPPRFKNILMLSGLAAVGGCGAPSADNAAAQVFRDRCSVENLLVGSEVANWQRLRNEVDAGAIRRDEISLEQPLPPSRRAQNDLEDAVESQVGEVTPLGLVDDRATVFTGPLHIQYEGRTIVTLTNFYLAKRSSRFPYLLAAPVKVESCYAGKGDPFARYIGRQS